MPLVSNQLLKPETWALSQIPSSSPISPHQWPCAVDFTSCIFLILSLLFPLSLPSAAPPHVLLGVHASSLPSSTQSDRIRCQPNHASTLLEVLHWLASSQKKGELLSTAEGMLQDTVLPLPVLPPSTLNFLSSNARFPQVSYWITLAKSWYWHHLYKGRLSLLSTVIKWSSLDFLKNNLVRGIVFKRSGMSRSLWKNFPSSEVVCGVAPGWQRCHCDAK